MEANGGSTRVPGAKKIIFSKVVPRPLVMFREVFLGRFEPVVVRYGPRKIPKCLENGPFWDQKWVKNGGKRVFPKVILDHSGCSNKWFGPILSPWCRVLAHGKSQNALKRGWFNTKNGSKLGEKRHFLKVIIGHLGGSKKCF